MAWELHKYTDQRTLKLDVLIIRTNCPCCIGNPRSPHVGTHHFLVSWGIWTLPKYPPYASEVQLVRDDHFDEVNVICKEGNARVRKVLSFD